MVQQTRAVTRPRSVHLARAHLPFAFACALLTFFLVIDRIYHLTDLVITKGCPSSW
jgi:hypothetical protein